MQRRIRAGHDGLSVCRSRPLAAVLSLSLVSVAAAPRISADEGPASERPASLSAADAGEQLAGIFGCRLFGRRYRRTWQPSPTPAPVPAPAQPYYTPPAPPAPVESPSDTKAAQVPAAAEQPEWTSLFDGRTLTGWKKTEFGGEGDVTIENGAIVLDFGADMSGITWTGKLPRMNYEISLEAKRVDGNDFFCGLTFPVAKDPCSFIVGGWGGGVVGLSSINGFDASENDTTEYMQFETGRWYHIRVRVTPGRIEAWIDDKQMVNQETEGRTISIRPEVELSKPLGIATWSTKGALRNIKLRRLERKAD